MATKLICDHCGAEINPKSSVTYAGMRRHKANGNTSGYNLCANYNDYNLRTNYNDYDDDYDLCVSCAHELRAWLSGKENDNG